MVHYRNAFISVAKKTTVKNAEGTKINKYDFDDPIATFRADVQPNTLTESQITLYGIDSRRAETKKCFFDDSVNLEKGARVEVFDDNGSRAKYEVMPVNEWRIHKEVLLIPVENE